MAYRSSYLGILAAMLFAAAMAGYEPAFAGEQEVARDFPSCGQQTEGITHCSGNRMCECAFMPENKGRGLPARFAWDCGVLRPSCGEELEATSNPYQAPLPSEVIVDTRRGGPGVLD